MKDIIEKDFDESDLWNLDYTISKFILPRLVSFRDLSDTYPIEFKNLEEWKNTLNKIIDYFEAEASNKIEDNLDNSGIELFAKYFKHLWI